MKNPTRTPQVLLAALFFGASLLVPVEAWAGEHRLGLGLHFWRTVDDIAGEGIEDDGLAYVASYQYIPQSLLKFELALEYFDGGFAGATDSAVSPIGYLIVGGKFYGAVGVGVTFSSSLPDDVSDPFFAARVGYQLAILPGIRIDFNANYRANAFSDLDQADTDAITLGAVVRFNL